MRRGVGKRARPVVARRPLDAAVARARACLSSSSPPPAATQHTRATQHSTAHSTAQHTAQHSTQHSTHLQVDEVLFELDRRLWVAAAVALHVLFDKRLEQLGELARVVRAVDDARAAALVIVGLRAELAAVKLEDVLGRAVERLGDLGVVHDVGLDAVAAALDLGGCVGVWVGVWEGVSGARAHDRRRGRAAPAGKRAHTRSSTTRSAPIDRAYVQSKSTHNDDAHKHKTRTFATRRGIL